MGFDIRRSTSVPSPEEMLAGGGVYLVEESSDGAVTQPGPRMALCIGEFTDMTYAVAVDASGVVTSNPRAVEVFSPTDGELKLGGLDSTLGQWGGALGNGWEQTQTHSFGALACIPINLAASAGIRMWRELSTNRSVTVAEPAVAIVPGVVPAGYEFKTGSSRLRTAARVVFKDTPHFASATDGVIVGAALPAATQAFTSASGLFTSVVRPDGSIGVKEGDAVVIGVIGGAAALGACARTYRVVSVGSATSLTLQRQDGSNFAAGNWDDTTALPFRIYPADVADTGADHQLSEAGGYLIPCRPLDATVAADTNVNPTVAPTAAGASSWDPLSGLTLRTIPTTGCVYVAAKHAPNAANATDIDTEYGYAFAALSEDSSPASDALFVWSARKYDLVHARGLAWELTASAIGRKRHYVESPILTTTTADAALGDASPGVGARRDENKFFCWPAIQHDVAALRNMVIATADGKTTTDGRIDSTFDAYVCSVLSKLAPHRSIAQTADPVKSTMISIKAIQRGVTTSTLTPDYYKRAYRKGVIGPRWNKKNAVFLPENQRTSSLNSDQQNINRTVMAGYVGDALAFRMLDFNEEPYSPALAATMLAEATAFGEEMLSRNDSTRSIIANYYAGLEDAPDLVKQNIVAIRFEVQLIGIARAIVIRLRVGNGAVTTSFE